MVNKVMVNWSTRIGRIVVAMFPVEDGWCMWQKQAAIKARIIRGDKIKIAVSRMEEGEQDAYLTELEKKIEV